jgi:hypothetical protein
LIALLVLDEATILQFSACSTLINLPKTMMDIPKVGILLLVSARDAAVNYAACSVFHLHLLNSGWTLNRLTSI